MAIRDWRARLQEAIDRDGRSLRRICIDAGMKPDFLSQLMRNGKDPLVGNFLKICDSLNVSPAYILTGARMDTEGEKLLRLWAKASEAQRQAFLILLDAQ